MRLLIRNRKAFTCCFRHAALERSPTLSSKLSAFYRKTALLAGLILPALLLVAASMAQEQAPEKPQTAKEKFKNIKVLKDLPADQLIPVMRKWNTALGVKCDFCHTIAADHSGFEKDNKPEKSAARKMVQMTNDINKRHKVVEKKVKCITCHQGNKEPKGE